MKLLLFTIIFLVFLQTTFAVTLSQNGIEHYHGREIKIITLQETKAIISVDDEKAIFNVGDVKEINGVKIKVEEIFYSNELSTINLDLSLSYECGDKICSEFESYKNCCNDCGCEENKQCVDNECITPECFNNKDCDDQNDLTEDKCEDYKCKYKMIKCKQDSDCNDNNPDTDDFCTNGKCKNIQNYVCKSDIDCDDDNPCTLDLCINKDCQYNQIEDCKKETPKEEETKKAEEIINNVKEGFFRRLLSWIKNLF